MLMNTTQIFTILNHSEDIKKAKTTFLIVEDLYDKVKDVMATDNVTMTNDILPVIIYDVLSKLDNPED